VRNEPEHAAHFEQEIAKQSPTSCNAIAGAAINLLQSSPVFCSAMSEGETASVHGGEKAISSHGVLPDPVYLFERQKFMSARCFLICGLVVVGH